MKSKVKDYQELYNEYQDYMVEIIEIEQPILGIQREIKNCTKQQEKVDYTNIQVVSDAMQSHIDIAIKEKKKELQQEISNETKRLINAFDKLEKKIQLVLKWLPKKECERVLSEPEIDILNSIDVEEAKKNNELTIISSLNNIFGIVFRFKFLKFFPKVLQILASIIVWGILLIPSIFNAIMNSYDNKFSEYLRGLDDAAFYEQERLRILGEFSKSVIVAIVIIFLLILIINAGTFIYARLSATKYVRKYAGIFKVYFDAEAFKKEAFNKKYEIFEKEQVEIWKDEIKHIQANDVDLEKYGEQYTIFSLVRNSLKVEYEKLEVQITELNRKIENLKQQTDAKRIKAESLIPDLQEKARNLIEYIDDDDYNDWVLSPYVSIGYSNTSNDEIRELISFEHNYKPIILCYSEESKDKGERFRKNEAHLVELFMHGFMWENNAELVKMWLVNFGGLHFPESRTQGFMSVINTQQALNKLYDELKRTSAMVDKMGDGRIQHINPKRKMEREQPVEYNIVFFVGYNFKAIENEIAQLFVKGENFGFLPIVLIEQEEMKNLIADKNLSREFSSVLKMAKENEQIYSFEGVVSEFEYNFIISNQKEKIASNFYVNKIMSFDEFWTEATTDEGIDLDSKTLFVDTYELPEDLYLGIVEATDDYALFTINDEIPAYLSNENIKKLS